MIKCGWASIDENGKAHGGKAGDQTGREVKVGYWYEFGQNAAYRFIDRKAAEKYSAALKKICNCNLVGYDRYERTTLYNALKAVSWDVDKYIKSGKKTECDCSELVAVCVNIAFGKEMIPSYAYTGNLGNLLMNTGKFKKLTGSKYCDKDTYLGSGDILNAPGHHVISVLENGAGYGENNNLSVAEPTLKKGSTGSQTKKLQTNLNKLGFKDSAGKKLETDGVFGACTLEALRKFQKKHNLDPDGIYGPKSYKAMKEALK